SMAAVRRAWQLRQAASVMARLRGPIWIGSSNRLVVKAKEWFQPLTALVNHLPAKSCGVWQSLHTATAWWLARVQPSYCSRMMWQFKHAFGSLVRYEAPR